MSLDDATVGRLRAAVGLPEEGPPARTTPVHGTPCADCGRPMIPQPVYNHDTALWRSRGFVRHGAGERCNGCYSRRWKAGKTGRPAPAPRPSAPCRMTIERAYTVVCDRCGQVDTATTAAVARELADGHITRHLDTVAAAVRGAS